MTPPKDDIFQILNKSLPAIKEKDIVLITSKIVSIHQKRCVKITSKRQKDKIIKKESDYTTTYTDPNNHTHRFAITHNTILGGAGIDQSNGDNFHILLPKDTFKIAKEIWSYIKKEHNTKELGVIITDSKSQPLRYGTIGTAIAFWGINPINNHIGKTDLFGRKMIMEKSNTVDPLAAAATLLTGETDEQTPITIARNIHNITFTQKNTQKELFVKSLKEDIFYPMLRPFEEKTL